MINLDSDVGQSDARDALQTVIAWNERRDELRHDIAREVINSYALDNQPPGYAIEDQIEEALNEAGPGHPLISKGLSAGGPSACYGPTVNPYLPRYNGFCYVPSSAFALRFLYGQIWWNTGDTLCAFLNAAMVFDAGQSVTNSPGSRWNFRWDSHWAVGNLNSWFGINGPHGINTAYNQTFQACQVAILT